MNLLALIYGCITRPYYESINNVMMIMNDVGVIIVLGTMYPMLTLYVSDATFYLYGRLIIGSIAGVVYLNFFLFVIQFVLKLKFLCCCNCKKALKELIIMDPEDDIPKEKEVYSPKTPPPEPEKTPTPPREPTPESPSEYESSSEEIKEPTPEPSVEELEIPASAVLVKEDKFGTEGEGLGMADTMSNTQQLGLVNPQRFLDQSNRKVKFADNTKTTGYN